MLMRPEGFSDERIHYGKRTLSVAIGMGQACILMEFACYIVIYLSLREQNRSFFQIVQEDILKKKKPKRMLSLLPVKRLLSLLK